MGESGRGNGAPAAIFLNHGAGSADTERVRRAVARTRRLLDADLHETATRSPAELEAWLRAHLDGRPYRTVVIVGGDGSLGVGYNVVADRPDTRLGYLPAGFGNATAHLLRLPTDPERLARTIAHGQDRPVDLVAVDGRLALFAGAGWDALVAGRYAAAGARRLRGWASAVVRSIPDLWRRAVVEVRADGWLVHRGPLEIVVVSTTPFYGRGLRVNPGARPDAGRLVMRVYPGPVVPMAAETLRWALRLRPRAAPIAAREISLEVVPDGGMPLQADGDLVGVRSSWHLAIRPRAVRLIGRWR